MVLFTCLLIHSGIFDGRHDSFSQTFTTALYFLVQTSTTAGYGDLLLVYETWHLLILTFELLCAIAFFAYFLARMKMIFEMMIISYSSLVLSAEEDMHSWLSVRDRDAGKRESEDNSRSYETVIKKISLTYSSFIIHHIAGAVQEADLYHKLSDNHQRIITDRAMTNFLQTFSYLTKTLGIESMRRLFSKMTTRV